MVENGSPSIDKDFGKLIDKMDNETVHLIRLLVRLDEVHGKEGLDAVNRMLEEALAIQETCSTGRISEEEGHAKFDKFCGGIISQFTSYNQKPCTAIAV